MGFAAITHPPGDLTATPRTSATVPPAASVAIAHSDGEVLQVVAYRYSGPMTRALDME